MTAGWRQVFRLVRLVMTGAARKFLRDNGPFLSSALAFNLLLYFIPLSLLMVSLLGYTVLDSERAMGEVQSTLRAFLPRSQEVVGENLVVVVANRGLLGFVGFVSFLIFSTFLFGSVRTALNRVFCVRQERPFMRGMGIDVLMMASSAILLFLAVGSTWFLAIAGAFVERYPNWIGLVQPGLAVLSKVVGAAITACLFYVLYRFAPAATISIRALVLASIAGTFLFQAARWGFRWYVALAGSNVELYGAFGGVIFLFIWLYYASSVFVLAAEIGWSYDGMRQGHGGRVAGM